MRSSAALRFLAGTGDTRPPAGSAAAPTDAEALDTYSRTVTQVADRLLPSVASVSTRWGRGRGAGSGVVITPNRFLITSAHVVAGGAGGTATLMEGRDAPFSVVGRDALSDLAGAPLREPASGPGTCSSRWTVR
jgi:S1-C subfamily serine protease